MKIPKDIVSDVDIALGIIKADASPVHLRAAADLLAAKAQQIREHLQSEAKPQLGLRLTR